MMQLLTNQILYRYCIETVSIYRDIDINKYSDRNSYKTHTQTKTYTAILEIANWAFERERWVSSFFPSLSEYADRSARVLK